MTHFNLQSGKFHQLCVIRFASFCLVISLILVKILVRILRQDVFSTIRHTSEKIQLGKTIWKYYFKWTFEVFKQHLWSVQCFFSMFSFSDIMTHILVIWILMHDGGWKFDLMNWLCWLSINDLTWNWINLKSLNKFRFLASAWAMTWKEGLMEVSMGLWGSKVAFR